MCWNYPQPEKSNTLTLLHVNSLHLNIRQVYIFSQLFSIHFLSGWQGEFESFFSWWSVHKFSWSWSVTQRWYCKYNLLFLWGKSVIRIDCWFIICYPQSNYDKRHHSIYFRSVNQPWLPMECILIECCKSKTRVVTIRPIRRRKDTFKSQWELKVKQTKLIEVQQNASNQVVLGFSFVFDWLREWWTNHRVKQSKNKAILNHFQHSNENC